MLTTRDLLPVLLICTILVMHLVHHWHVKRLKDSRKAWKDCCKLIVHVIRKDREPSKLIDQLSEQERLELTSIIAKAKALHDV